ncbi:MAG: hypothetical protein MUD01_11110 [Chloroflexaceae bacterium]|jgi:hypothetical protein|nr:hypothetical protein [Chloroflexaceae bacterium]
MDLSKFLKRAINEADAFLRTLEEPDPNQPVGQLPAPVQRKVATIVFNPPVPSAGNRPLNQVMGWNRPEDLIPKYIDDLRYCSYGYANYQVVEENNVGYFPVKEDGFAYSADEFVACMRQGSGFHQPDGVNYHRILADFDIINKVNSGAIDEVWMFGFPYAGFYESRMAGPGAFWCNAPPLEGTDNATRRFVIMGYNYERGVGEMLENMGHRAESIMQQTYRYTFGEDNVWQRFTRYDKTHPGQAEVGIVHFAPNSERDYDWGNPIPVLSRCHTWRRFPDLSGEPQEYTCTEWGDGDIRLHHIWWFRHFPHITGSANGVAYNWWQYVIDPNYTR